MVVPIIYLSFIRGLKVRETLILEHNPISQHQPHTAPRNWSQTNNLRDTVRHFQRLLDNRKDKQKQPTTAWNLKPHKSEKQTAENIMAKLPDIHQTREKISHIKEAIKTTNLTSDTALKTTIQYGNLYYFSVW